ncbi:MAG: mechanosensitive ion channel family protein [Halovenus sp.]
MSAPTALLVPLLFDEVLTTTGQYLATLVVVVVFLLALLLLRAAGSLLRNRTDPSFVRFTQGLLLSVVAVVATGVLVAVWGLTGEIQDALNFLVPSAAFYVRALVTFIVLVLSYTFTRLTKRSIKLGAARKLISGHQREVAHHVVQIVVFIPVATFIVVLWGIPVQSVFLGAGALGIIIGFAARQTLSGALSGFVILLARPFVVGDWIAVNGREGIVTDITLYNTQIRTFDEEHVLVSNADITTNDIVNYTKSDRLRLVTDVGVDYDCDVAAAATIAHEAMVACDAVASDPEPDVIRDAFGDNAVVLKLRYWIDEPTIVRKNAAQDEVISAVKTAFEDEGIEIPFPQRELSTREGTVDAVARHQARASDQPRADGEGDGSNPPDRSGDTTGGSRD